MKIGLEIIIREAIGIYYKTSYNFLFYLGTLIYLK